MFRVDGDAYETIHVTGQHLNTISVSGFIIVDDGARILIVKYNYYIISGLSGTLLYPVGVK